ncbi:hypothetical protein CTAYLR_004051 [Chrysophaeum taylorii]|uniref:Transglutaminase-like domain-containing protein n=1 Tax=Chrysophaeum taylorii TaxID=2483200 RepID=A0AAD7UNH7_9STRA|nr:hypothetical protein CTAYLR_004051 [Chrysophaeum taylorii]
MSIVSIARSIAGDGTAVERAVRLHDFVRDIEFGFTYRFEAATPQETLQFGVGHCVPKAQLFCALLKTQGIEARVQLAEVGGRVLDGLLPAPPTVLHAWTDVRLGGECLSVDSYVVDTKLFASAKAKLRNEAGYDLCRFHSGSWAGFERGKLFGTATSDPAVADQPLIVFHWDCCAAVDKASPGCAVAPHASYADS